MSGRFADGVVAVFSGARVRALAGWSAKALVLLAIAGADCRSRGVQMVSSAALVDGSAPAVAVRITGQAGALSPGGAALRSVFVHCPKPGGPDVVTVRWVPPAGATEVTFPGVQPSNPQGPAPFEFDAVDVTDSGDPLAPPSLAVAYAAPAPPQPTGGAVFVDCFTAALADGNEYSATFEDTVVGSGAITTAAAGTRVAPDRQEPSSVSAALRQQRADGYRWWQAAVTLQPTAAVPLGQALCQEWVAFLQDPSFFVAVRFPATADVADSRSAPLPLVVVDAATTGAPRVELRTAEEPPATVFTAALELRPDRLGVATAVLPVAAGERWMTLGVSPAPPATCAEGFAGTWALYGELALDLGGADDSCRECVLDQYLCYEGSEPPFFFLDAASAAMGVNAAATVQRSGVTCAGPIPLRLAGNPPAPPIAIAGANLQRANTNTLVKLAHTLRAWLASGEEADITLAVSSARGFVPWSLYLDSALQHPIQGPITISGSAQFDFWAAAQLPFGFRGKESLTVAAALAEPPGGSTTAADHLWVGAWAPPPSPVALVLESGAIYEGAPVRASGSLPDGDYRLVVVPNGAWVPSECYAGSTPVAAVDVAVSENTLPTTTVWPAATVGTFDVLALSGQCPLLAGAAGVDAGLAEGDALIAACADCSAAAGVVVKVRPPTVLAVEASSLDKGDTLRVSGSLPDGDYRLVVVPNGAWAADECYSGDALAAVDLTVSEYTLPLTVVWPAAPAGSFDVLALSGQCALAAGVLAPSDAKIVACDDCSEAAGVEITVPPTPLRRHLRRRP